jgi:hypothetical protein
MIRIWSYLREDSAVIVEGIVEFKLTPACNHLEGRWETEHRERRAVTNYVVSCVRVCVCVYVCVM